MAATLDEVSLIVATVQNGSVQRSLTMRKMSNSVNIPRVYDGSVTVAS